jgi:hypothetical protein
MMDASQTNGKAVLRSRRESGQGGCTHTVDNAVEACIGVIVLAGLRRLWRIYCLWLDSPAGRDDARSDEPIENLSRAFWEHVC